MSFTGNDVLLSSRLIQFSDTTPITVTQDGNTCVVTFQFNYDSSQFTVDAGNFKIKSIPTSVVSGLDDTIESYEQSFASITNDLNALDGVPDLVGVLNQDVSNLKLRIDALEAGSVDLSDYVATDGIKLTANGNSGIKFITTTGAPVTVNGKTIVTEDALSAYQKTSEKNAANGYVGLDGNTKISTSYLPVDGTTIVVTDGNLTVSPSKVSMLDSNGKIDATQVPVGTGLKIASGAVTVDTSKVVTLNENNKIDRELLGTLNIQECYSANVTEAGVITVLEGFTLDDVEIGDAIIINTGSTTYKSGSFWYRKSTSNNNITDFSEMIRDITAATKAQVNAGTLDTVYITPSALNGSSPALDGANFTNISGSAVSKATDSAYGVVKVTVGNGLSNSNGTISVSQASSSSFGTIKVTASNGLNISGGVLSISTATASAAGTVILNGKGISVGSNGSFSVAVVKDSNTLTGDGGNTALKVNLNSNGGLTADSSGIKINVDGTLLVLEGGKLVNKAVSHTEMDEAIAEAMSNASTKQPDIQIVKNSNYANSRITVAATAVPAGLRRNDGKFIPISPSTVTVSNGTYTSVIDVTGLTALDTNTWYVVF